jgi:hypothetical protein
MPADPTIFFEMNLNFTRITRAGRFNKAYSTKVYSSALDALKKAKLSDSQTLLVVLLLLKTGRFWFVWHSYGID